MRATLNVLAEELRRLRANGVTSVTISDEALRALRAAVSARGGAAPELQAPPASTTEKQVGPDLGQAGSAPIAQTTSNRLDQGRALQKPTAATPAKPTLPPPPVVKLPEGDKATRWQALCRQVSEDPVCQSQVRAGKKIVVGVGSLDAKIFFCGEAPGADEEIAGEPFVGPAGQLLTKMIQAAGLKREEVYIGNIMNWRPQMPLNADGEQVGNRPPTPEELSYCLPYLRAQLEIVNPELIVALGATATQGLLGAGTFKTLGEVRGRWHDFMGKPVMVTYHPSYILRNPTNRSKRAIWEDFLLVMERAQLAISDKQRRFFLDK